MEQTTKSPKFVRWAILLGIVIALNLFFFAARSFVVIEPVYDDYCPTTVQPAATSDTCVDQGGVWVETPSDPRVSAVTKPNMEGYCDLYRTCQPLYDEAHKQYQMYSFALMVGLGILALVVGVIPMGSSIVSSGLSYGGVLALIIAEGSYWGDAGQILRLVMSLIALGALLYIGIKRFKD